MTLDRAAMLATTQRFSTNLATLPHFASTATRLRKLLPAAARRVDRLRTGRTRAGMAQQHTLVSAIRFERLAARFTARVRQEPRIQLRILHLAAIAVIARWKVLLVVLSTTFRTENAARADQIGRDILFITRHCALTSTMEGRRRSRG